LGEILEQRALVFERAVEIMRGGRKDEKCEEKKWNSCGKVGRKSLYPKL